MGNKRKRREKRSVKAGDMFNKPVTSGSQVFYEWKNANPSAKEQAAVMILNKILQDPEIEIQMDELVTEGIQNLLNMQARIQATWKK